MMMKKRASRKLVIMALMLALALPAVAQEESQTKSGYEDVPQFGGPSSVGANLKEDNEIRKPFFRLEGIDKALKPWFDWKGSLNKKFSSLCSCP